MAAPNDSGSRTGWLARWEDQQQAKFDRELADDPERRAEWAALNIEVRSPAGRSYLVRTRRRGAWISGAIFNMDPSFGAALEFVLALARLPAWLVAWASRRLRGDKADQWTIGVIRYGWFFYSGLVVWRQDVPLGVDERRRATQIADDLRNGTLDVRSWLSPWRKV